MTPHPPVTTADAAPSGAAEVVLREQHLSVSTARVPTERVVLRRRVVTEVRQVEVTVQREELEVLRLPLDPQQQARPSAHVAPITPLVIVLSEQVPTVQMHNRAYQQVTVTVDVVAAEQQVHEQVSREQVEISQGRTEPSPR